MPRSAGMPLSTNAELVPVLVEHQDGAGHLAGLHRTEGLVDVFQLGRGG